MQRRALGERVLCRKGWAALKGEAVSRAAPRTEPCLVWWRHITGGRAVCERQPLRKGMEPQTAQVPAIVTASPCTALPCLSPEPRRHWEKPSSPHPAFQRLSALCLLPCPAWPASALGFLPPSTVSFHFHSNPVLWRLLSPVSR